MWKNRGPSDLSMSFQQSRSVADWLGFKSCWWLKIRNCFKDGQSLRFWVNLEAHTFLSSNLVLVIPPFPSCHSEDWGDLFIQFLWNPQPARVLVGHGQGLPLCACPRVWVWCACVCCVHACAEVFLKRRHRPRAFLPQKGSAWLRMQDVVWPCTLSLCSLWRWWTQITPLRPWSVKPRPTVLPPLHPRQMARPCSPPRWSTPLTVSTSLCASGQGVRCGGRFAGPVEVPWGAFMLSTLSMWPHPFACHFTLARWLPHHQHQPCIPGRMKRKSKSRKQFLMVLLSCSTGWEVGFQSATSLP